MAKARAASPSLPAVEHVTIRFSEILGPDADLDALLDGQWAVSDFGFPINDHDRAMLKFAYTMNPMVVIRRRDGYDVLGAGRAYWLAQQLYQAEDDITVLRVTSGRLRKEQKLLVLAADLVVPHTLARTRPHLAHQLYLLHQAISQAGFTPITESEPKSGVRIPASAQGFAVATGYSLDAVLPRRERKRRRTAEHGKDKASL